MIPWPAASRKLSIPWGSEQRELLRFGVGIGMARRGRCTEREMANGSLGRCRKTRWNPPSFASLTWINVRLGRWVRIDLSRRVLR